MDQNRKITTDGHRYTQIEYKDVVVGEYLIAF
jgi:hypothetical protein